MADSHFDAKSIGLRAQKKLLGKMSNKKIIKVFIDDTGGRVLDNLYRISREYSDKKTAEKIMKDMIKTVIKIGILYRNEQFSVEELGIADSFKKKFRTIAMTIVSFYQVDFTFDKNFLHGAFNECCSLLCQLVQRHLTTKSLGRINNVFSFFGNPSFLEMMFRVDSPYRSTLGTMVDDLNKMMEDGTL